MSSIFLAIPMAAIIGGAAALVVACLLVITQSLHGHHSTDGTIGPQKFHTKPTPRVGGIAIVAGVLTAYTLAQPRHHDLLRPLLLAGIPAFVFGLAEDLTKRVSVRARLLATMACGLLGWAITGLSIKEVNVVGLDWLLGFTVVSVAFTAIAVGGIANAINIVDGFNGLAAGTSAIILGSFAVMAGALGDADLSAVCLLMGAAVLGFGLVNWPMGKIFLGDGGAYFVGFAIAWLAVLLMARHAEISAWAVLLVCAYPVLEVLFSMVRRRRRNLSTGTADRMHMHSLVKRRVVRFLLPRGSNLLRNSVTGAIMWAAGLIPAALALHLPGGTSILITAFVGCAFLYAAVYARITQFRWCVGARTLQVVAPIASR